MKKGGILLCFILSIFFVPSVFAESDYENDYTLIDCVDGNDDTAIAFDSSQPYQTLKSGIEQSIANINSNVNKVGNEESASGAIFNIKVNCMMNQMLSNSIDLNFFGETYFNNLVIEGNKDTPFIIERIIFTGSGNGIIFKNILFKNPHGYFFSDITGVKIKDSIIKLKTGEQLGRRLYGTYTSYERMEFYINKIFLDNVEFSINLTGDTYFGLPSYVKNSRFNITSELNKRFKFIIQYPYAGGRFAQYNNFYGYQNIINNEFNFGGNKLLSWNGHDVTFINNKFSNFSEISLGTSIIFLNNTFENSESIDISANKNMYNNIFKSGFIDTYDIMNVRKNYHVDNIGPKGVGWIFRKHLGNKMFEVDTSSHKLYKEITGQDIPMSKDSVYVIY